MWVVMQVRHWEDLGMQGSDGVLKPIHGLSTPIPGGGAVPVTAFLPVFSTYEHAEAARGDDERIRIHEIATLEELERREEAEGDDYAE